MEGFAAQDLANHAAAACPGADFEEAAEAVGVGLADRLGEGDAMGGLFEDAGGGALAIESVAGAAGAAVETHAHGRVGLEEVVVVVAVGDGGQDLAVDGDDALQREETRAHGGDQRLDSSALAADDGFARGVTDQQVRARMRGQVGADLVGAAQDDADGPVDRLLGGQVPEGAHRLAVTGKLSAEQIAVARSQVHGIVVAPGTGGEEGGGFAQAVADCRAWA